MKRYGLHSFLFTGLLLSAAAVSSRAHAEQFVLLDLTYEATSANTMDSHFRATPAANIPKNLKTPIDYASGTAYVRFEVLAKPSAAKTLYNICFDNPSNYACLPYPPAYTATSVNNFNAPFSAFWQGDLVDWSMGIAGVQLVIKDEKEVKVQGNAMFYPYKTHITITLVSPGSTYVPPDMPAAGAGGMGAAGAAAAGRGGAGASGSGGARAGSGGAGASGSSAAGSSSDAGETADAAGAGGSGSGTTSEAGSAAFTPDAGSSEPGAGEIDEAAAASGGAGTTGQLPAQGVGVEEDQQNKRAPPPGNIEAGCATVVPRGDRTGARDLAALSCLVALLGGERTRRRRRQSLQRSA
ncbi:MAG TPA: hypothetical protein VFG30_11510 [Polyangiales bacterium]|nr:hypothetical protein [Polyangiales bacterium]